MIFIKKLKLIKDHNININISSSGKHTALTYFKEGQYVKPTDLMAKVFRSDNSIKIDLKVELDIKPVKGKILDINKYINVLDGQIVLKDQIIAHKFILGIERVVKAPFEGIISINIENFILTINSIPYAIDIFSNLYGKVLSITKDTMVIMANVFCTNLVYTNGIEFSGRLKNVEDITDNNESINNSVILYNSHIDKSIYKNFIKYNIKGIIALSADPELLTLTNDQVGLCVLEGFSKTNNNLYKKLEYSDGQLVYLDAIEKKLYVSTSLGIEDINVLYFKDLATNDLVEIYDHEYYGSLGIVKEINQNDVKLELDSKSPNSFVSIGKNNLIGILN